MKRALGAEGGDAAAPSVSSLTPDAALAETQPTFTASTLQRFAHKGGGHYETAKTESVMSPWNRK